MSEQKSWWEELPREGFTFAASEQTKKNMILPEVNDYLLRIQERQLEDMKEGWND